MDGKDLIEAINSGEVEVCKSRQLSFSQTSGELEVFYIYYVFPSKKLVLKKEEIDD